MDSFRTPSAGPARGAAIRAAYGVYQEQFQAITRRAKSRFEQLDWHGMNQDALERLELYGQVITDIAAEIRELLDGSVKDQKLWAVIKAIYSGLIAERTDIELAETFFNSVTRRIFTRVGVDPRIEFLFSDFDAPTPSGEPPYHVYRCDNRLPEVIQEILAACSFSVPFEDLRAMRSASSRRSSASARPAAWHSRSTQST